MKLALILLITVGLASAAHHHNRHRARRENIVQEPPNWDSGLWAWIDSYAVEIKKIASELFPETKITLLLKALKESGREAMAELPEFSVDDLDEEQIDLNKIYDAEYVRTMLLKIYGENDIDLIDDWMQEFEDRKAEIEQQYSKMSEETLDDLSAKLKDRLNIESWRDFVEGKVRATRTSISGAFSQIEASLTSMEPEDIAKFRTVIDYITASQNRAIKGFDSVMAEPPFPNYLTPKVVEHIETIYKKMWKKLVTFVEGSEVDVDTMIANTKPAEMHANALKYLEKAKEKLGKMFMDLDGVVKSETCDEFEEKAVAMLEKFYPGYENLPDIVESEANLCRIYSANHDKTIGEFVKLMKVRAKETALYEKYQKMKNDYDIHDKADIQALVQKKILFWLKNLDSVFRTVKTSIDNKLEASTEEETSMEEAGTYFF